MEQKTHIKHSTKNETLCHIIIELYPDTLYDSNPSICNCDKCSKEYHNPLKTNDPSIMVQANIAANKWVEENKGWEITPRMYTCFLDGFIAGRK